MPIEQGSDIRHCDNRCQRSYQHLWIGTGAIVSGRVLVVYGKFIF